MAVDGELEVSKHTAKRPALVHGTSQERKTAVAIRGRPRRGQRDDDDFILPIPDAVEPYMDDSDRDVLANFSRRMRARMASTFNDTQQNPFDMIHDLDDHWPQSVVHDLVGTDVYPCDERNPSASTVRTAEHPELDEANDDASHADSRRISRLRRSRQCAAPAPNMKVMKSFRMDEEDKVVQFLADRISRLQQLSNKKIAKDWISVICPRKQANFPYQNKKHQYQMPVTVPLWWPDVEKCPFTEPDHVKREQRNHLVLHLLRFRPTPEQFVEMNKGKCQADPTHQFESWTAFLRKKTPPSCLDGLLPNKKAEQRRELLSSIFEVAEKEEYYKNHGMNETYCYPDDDDEVVPTRSSTRKRRRRAVSPDASAEWDRSSSTIRPKKSSRKERDCSEPVTVEPAQLIRRSTGATSNGDGNDAEAEEDIADDVKMQVDGEWPTDEDRATPGKVVISSRSNPPAGTDKKSIPVVPSHPESRISPPEPLLLPHGTPCPPEMQRQMTVWPAQQTSPPNSLDAAHTAGVLHPWDPYQASIGGQTFFPGNRDYPFPPQWSSPEQHTTRPQAVQVYQADYIPRPRFNSTPAAVFPHGSLLPSGPVSLDSATGQTVIAGSQPFQWNGAWVEHTAPHVIQPDQDYLYGLPVTNQPAQPIHAGFAPPCPTSVMQASPWHPTQQHPPQHIVQSAGQDPQQLQTVPHGFTG